MTDTSQFQRQSVRRALRSNIFTELSRQYHEPRRARRRMAAAVARKAWRTREKQA